jgi:CPA2 family monovalent cation:H+ antiporter-2
MVAMRREVFGLGLAQMAVTTAAFSSIGMLLGLSWLVALVIGGALSMASTAIVIRQLTEQAEINRTHGRLALSILLFQDLAFVLLLALATLIVDGTAAQGFGAQGDLRTLGSGLIALLVVLFAGRVLLRPLFVNLNSRLKAVHAFCRWCWPRPG